MNPQLRKQVAPLTPNLEEIKQRNKSKSRRKPYSIQPTNPPTPKIHKAHINLKPTNDKITEMHGKQQLGMCPKHPERRATHYIEASGNRKYCNKCYLMNRDSDQYDEEVQIQKRRELDQFKGKIKGFGLKLQEAQSCQREWNSGSQQNFYSQKLYIKEAFDNIREVVEQKQREMMNNLMIGQQNIKKQLSKNFNEIQQIKKSINRYIEDIEINYQDIIEQLSYEQFNDIIDRYNKKLYYFEEKIECFVFDTSLNAYIPKKQIQKQIQKSQVQVYPYTLEDSSSFQNKTLQRYTTQKNNLFIDYQFPMRPQPYQSHHHQSLNTKPNNRQSRDRYEYNNREITGQSKIHSKQNYNTDNMIFY